MATLTNAQILNGSQLILFINGNPIAFGTTDSISITPNTTEIATKSHGLYPSLYVNSIGWEVTTENLASMDGIKALNAILDGAKDQTPVTLKFGQPANWQENGIVNNEQPDWTTPGATAIIAEGKAMLTSYTINAPAQENGTISATFTGVGELKLLYDAQPNSGNQGAQGTQGN